MNVAFVVKYDEDARIEYFISIGNDYYRVAVGEDGTKYSYWGEYKNIETAAAMVWKWYNAANISVDVPTPLERTKGQLYFDKIAAFAKSRA